MSKAEQISLFEDFDRSVFLDEGGLFLSEPVTRRVDPRPDSVVLHPSFSVLASQKSALFVATNVARVFVIGDRYFYGFGKKGQVLTSWSLSGGLFFPSWDTPLYLRIISGLELKNKLYYVATVTLGKL